MGGFFRRVSLEGLGLVVNLGHGGDSCPIFTNTEKMLVVDLSGHHAVHVRPCKCSKSGFLENYRQLLRVGWYPASFLRPKTVFTFDLLDTYHKISLQGKLNLYDFYNAIMQKTDNHGCSKVKVRVLLLVATPSDSFSPHSIGTMRCHGVYANGVTSRTSKEVQQAIRLPRSMNSTMDLSPSNALLVPIRDETYLLDGILSLIHARKLLGSLH